MKNGTTLEIERSLHPKEDIDNRNWHQSQTTMKTILILSANPKGTSVLQLEREIRNIREGLERSQNREQFQSQQRGAVRVEDLRRSLLEVKPTIVHFCGHGTGERGLVLEDDASEPHLATFVGYFYLKIRKL